MFEFTKMHALGNDFVVIDGIDQSVSFNPSLAQLISDRHLGIGCDQILLVNNDVDDANVFDFRIFNADGSESAQCGNGARCVARLLYDRGYPSGSDFVLRTSADDLQCSVNETQITVSLGVPNFDPPEIPFLSDSEQKTYDLQVEDQIVQVSALSLGNPHAVMLVEDVSRAPVETTGPIIESHPRFPERTNVGYLEIVSRMVVRLRVYERGVGETLACGSGASAAVVAGIERELLDESVQVELTAGALLVEWNGRGTQTMLTGPATYVYQGHWLSE